MRFDILGLCAPLLRAIEERGYREPSPVQAAAIPAVLSGRDLMAAARTGTGKTAGFTLPILQRLYASGDSQAHRLRALILVPTRELAAQVGESVAAYGAHLPFTSAVVFGGVKINPQLAALRRGVDILVATPGRLLDLYQQGELSFSALEILVLDEADRMLDLGFIRDIRRIVEALPPQRQNLLFSATFSRDIRQLTKTILRNPLEVSVSAPNATAERVAQWVYPVDKKRKGELLLDLVQQCDWQQVLVFIRTRQGADRLVQYLQQCGIDAAAIHSDKSQGVRSRTLAGFKCGEVRVLVATDIAARGLDIAQLPQVVNFDLPTVPEDYVHRIGRTGRAGLSGHAYSLVSADEIKQLTAIEQLIQRHIPREYIGGFEPGHEVPASPPLRKSRTGRQQAPAGRPVAPRRRGQSRSDSRGRGKPGAGRRAPNRRGGRRPGQ